MRKKVFVSVLTLLFIGSFVFAEEYRSPHFGFTVEYPTSWKQMEMEKVAMFFSPEDNAKDLVAKVIIGVDEGVGMSLDQFREIHFEDFHKHIIGAKIVERSNTVINGKSALYWIYDSYQDSYDLRNKTYMFIENSKSYSLTFSAAKTDYNRYLPTAESIIQSFRTQDDIASESVYKERSK